MSWRRIGSGRRPRDHARCRCTWPWWTRTGRFCTPSAVCRATSERCSASRSPSPASAVRAVRSLSWQDGGEAWQGVLTHVPLVNERITAVPWAVVAYAPEGSFFARSQRIWQLLPFAILALIISALCAAQYLARAYLPTVRVLREALPALRRRYFEPLLAVRARRARGISSRRSIGLPASLHEQFHALETLGEIDKLLLGFRGARAGAGGASSRGCRPSPGATASASRCGTPMRPDADASISPRTDSAICP